MYRRSPSPAIQSILRTRSNGSVYQRCSLSSSGACPQTAMDSGCLRRGGVGRERQRENVGSRGLVGGWWSVTSLALVVLASRPVSPFSAPLVQHGCAGGLRGTSWAAGGLLPHGPLSWVPGRRPGSTSLAAVGSSFRDSEGERGGPGRQFKFPEDAKETVTQTVTRASHHHRMPQQRPAWFLRRPAGAHRGAASFRADPALSMHPPCAQSWPAREFREISARNPGEG